MKLIKKAIAAVLAAAILASATALPVSAKTISSDKAENVFFYATDGEGRSVLVDVLSLDELKAISHGQSGGGNYYVSSTDNYPTTQYLEARGFTLTELVDYVRASSTVDGAAGLGFSGGDTMRFMATDSYGNYSRSWSYDQLYGVERYYFEGLYDAETGWNTGWEIAGEDNSKFGISLEDYNANYRDSDPYYENKRAVFEAGEETMVILATESYSGRTTSDSLVASTEPGIASYVEANGGEVTGCLAEAMGDQHALRLCMPMTEADLMAAHRTAYDNFKWIYGLQLDIESAAISSKGTVAAPSPSFSLSGDTLTMTLSCNTAGASIYYGFEGSAQTLYTGPVTIDVSGRDLDSNPISVYAVAMKEGFDDEGLQTFKYPGMAPAFKSVYSAMAGSELRFEAAEGVSAGEWKAWTDALNFISVKTPGVNGYVTLKNSEFSIDNDAMTVSFDSSLFTETGSYSFIFHNTRYANKSVSVTMKAAAPELKCEGKYDFGEAITISFDNGSYQSGLYVYVTPEGGKRSLISASYLDKSLTGAVTIKPEYFSLASSAMSKPGAYTIELVNNSFAPASQTVSVILGTSFTDVLPGQWYFSYVTDLANAGVINGMGDGTFAPKGTLTWGQALKLLMLAAGYDEQTPTDKHWASGYIKTAIADGIISGIVEPNGEISRLQFCRAAANALKAETTLTSSPFADTDDPAVLALYEMGIINGMTETSFDPAGTLTRGQISKIIWCIMNPEEAK